MCLLYFKNDAYFDRLCSQKFGPSMLQQFILNAESGRLPSAGTLEVKNIEHRMVNSCISRVKEMDSMIARLFDISAEGTERAMCFRVVIDTMASERFSEESIRTHALSTLNQLPALITATSSSQEMELLLELTELLLRNGSAAYKSCAEKALQKTASLALALLEDTRLARFGLKILKLILLSPHRSCCNSSLPSIRDSSLQLLPLTETFDAAAECVALSIMSESANNWSSLWRNYVCTIQKALHDLGLVAHLPLISGASPLLLLDLGDSASGTGRAVHLERVIRGCCAGLAEMLLYGCATGPVSTELIPLLLFGQSFMSLDLELPPVSDSKYLVENDSGVSLVDVVLVATNIKMYFVDLMKVVVSTSSPSTLFPVASLISRSLSAAVSSRELEQAPCYHRLVLECCADVISTFPTVITKTGRFCDVVIGLFKSEMLNLTTIPDPESVDSNHLWRSVLVMDVVKQLLYFSGSALSLEDRGAIELSIGAGLACVAQGICTSGCSATDRKVRRMGSVDSSGVAIGPGSRRLVEPIRLNTEAQLALIEVAVADILCPASSGVLSGNIPLLKLVAEAMCVHYDVRCRSASRRILGVLDSMLHPCSIAIPAVSFQTLVKSHLAEKAMSALAAESAPHDRRDIERDEPSAVSASEEPVVSVTSEVAGESNVSGAVAPMKVPFKSLLSVDNPPKKADSSTIILGKRALRDEEDEDMELPDIVC